MTKEFWSNKFVKLGSDLLGTVHSKYEQSTIDSITKFIFTTLKFLVDTSNETNFKYKISDLVEQYPHIDYEKLMKIMYDDMKNNPIDYITIRHTIEEWKERTPLLELIKKTQYYGEDTRYPSVLKSTESGTTLVYIRNMSNQELKDYIEKYGDDK